MLGLQDAEKAQQTMHNKVIAGRALIVNFAQERVRGASQWASPPARGTRATLLTQSAPRGMPGTVVGWRTHAAIHRARASLT